MSPCILAVLGRSLYRSSVVCVCAREVRGSKLRQTLIPEIVLQFMKRHTTVVPLFYDRREIKQTGTKVLSLACVRVKSVTAS